MSIASLCDHQAVVYRAVTTRDDLQDVVESWEPLAAPAGKNCRPNQNWSGALQDPGPGSVQGAMRQWFLVGGFDVRQGDVLKIVSGPEAGTQLAVESVNRPTDPYTVHHIEVNVKPYTGEVL